MPNRKRRILLPFLLLTTILIITATSCNMFNEPEGGNGGSLTLTVEDASCTEAWIKLNETNAELPASVKLYANDSLKQTLELTTADTLIYDEGLLPNRSYAYRAELIKPQKPTVKSQTVTAATLDTTSHNFTWETFTFGGANGSSDLRDVAIINENDIWAVGEIHTSWTDQWDSNGVWVQPYNAVHWNGQEWELRRIDGNGYPRRVVYAFGKNDVWFDGVIKWDGNEYTVHTNNFPLEPNGDGWYRYGMWGTSSSDFYIVGQHGNIAHYDGSGWEKIESGTELCFHDIYGYNERKFCIAAELFSGINTELYQIKDGNAILDDRTNIGVSSVSVYVLKKKLYVFGYLRLVRIEGKNGWEEISEPVNFDGYSKIRGVGYNDIVAVGSFGKIDHFNGANWEKRRMGTGGNNLADFSSVSIKNNTVCAVGRINNSAFIVIGRR